MEEESLLRSVKEKSALYLCGCYPDPFRSSGIEDTFNFVRVVGSCRSKQPTSDTAMPFPSQGIVAFSIATPSTPSTSIDF